jgi:hypothetical protein
MGHHRTPLPSMEHIGARVLRGWWFLGLVSVAIVGLLALASCPWWYNRFLLTATTRSVEISASAPAVHVISIRLPNNSDIQIFGAGAVNLPPELSALAADLGSVRLAASSAVLQTISLPREARLVVSTTSSGSADIGILNGGSISLALSGVIERIDEKGRRTTLTNIEHAISWNIRPAERDSPARLLLPAGAETIALYGQPIDELWLNPPRPAGDDPRTYQSEILSGELRMLDTGTKIELRPRELVLLEGGSRMLSRLEIIGNQISVDVSGEANRISVGPPRPGTPFRLDRDLTPSVLSYLVGQHELKLLWGIALVILGALWKGRQWALKWGK